MNILLFLMMALGLLSCSTRENPLPQRPKTDLRLNMTAEPPCLDPQLVIDLNSSVIIKSLFEGLTREVEGGIKPALAKEIQVSPDKKTYTFHLHQTSWSNGAPLTAHDFAWTWKRSLAPNFPSLLSDQLYPIKNAQAVKEGKMPIEALGVRAIDDYTLEVRLEYPNPYFLNLTTQTIYLPVHRATAENNPNWAQQAGASYVSNGPFKLISWKHHNEIVLEKNPLYHDHQAVKIEKIHFSLVTDTITELHMYESGEIDFVGGPLSTGIPIDAIPSLKASGKLKVQPIAGIYMYCFNVEKSPFNNIKIRKAFSYAIDRQAIIDNILQMEFKPALGLSPPMIPFAKDAFFQDHQVNKAKKLLQEGLQELGLDIASLPPITLSYNTAENHQKIAQAIQNQWHTVLGIDVQLQNFEWKVFLDNLVRHEFQLARVARAAYYNDAYSLLENFLDNSNNATNWKNPEFNSLLEKSLWTIDPKERQALLARSEEILMDEMPMIPLYFPSFLYLQRDNLHGIFYSPLGYIDFKNAWFE